MNFKKMLSLSLLVFICGVADCEAEHDLDGSKPEYVEKEKKPDVIPDDSKTSKDNPQSKPEKQRACKKPSQVPLNPERGQGIVFDEEVCAYYVLPSIESIEAERKINHSEADVSAICENIVELAKSLNTPRSPTKNKKFAEQRATINKRNQDRYDSLTKKTLLNVRFSREHSDNSIVQEYKALNPDTQFPFKAFPVAFMKFEITPPVGSSGIHAFEYPDYHGAHYVAPMPTSLSLGYPIACEKNWKEDVQISAYLNYSLNLGFAHYRLELNKARILDKIVSLASPNHLVTKTSFEEILDRPWSKKAWKLEWLGEPQDAESRHKIEQMLKRETLSEIAAAIGTSSRPMRTGMPHVTLGWHFDYLLNPSQIADYKKEHDRDIVLEKENTVWDSGLLEVPYLF